MKWVTGLAVFSVFGLVVLVARNKARRVLLLGGLDTRPGDKNISSQVDLIKKGMSKNTQVMGFRYTDAEGLYAELNRNSNATVVLFSAGGSKAEAVARLMLENNEALRHLYILEPYHVGGTTTKSVRKAVELGVPPENVWVGGYAKAGLGVIANATRTPNCSPSHWCALTEVGKIISK